MDGEHLPETDVYTAALESNRLYAKLGVTSTCIHVSNTDILYGVRIPDNVILSRQEVVNFALGGYVPKAKVQLLPFTGEDEGHVPGHTMVLVNHTY